MQNEIDDCIQVFEHLRIRESQDKVAFAVQYRIPLAITRLVLDGTMLIAVEFDSRLVRYSAKSRK